MPAPSFLRPLVADFFSLPAFPQSCSPLGQCRQPLFCFLRGRAKAEVCGLSTARRCRPALCARSQDVCQRHLSQNQPSSSASWPQENRARRGAHVSVPPDLRSGAFPVSMPEIRILGDALMCLKKLRQRYCAGNLETESRTCEPTDERGFTQSYLRVFI